MLLSHELEALVDVGSNATSFIPQRKDVSLPK
jgi:hypothetical protein